MLTYLTGSVRPEITMAVHQCAQFLTSPMRSHELAVMKIRRYLIGSQDKGLVYTVDAMHGLETYMDANFASGWDPANADDASMLYSRTGFMIKYDTQAAQSTEKNKLQTAN